MADPAPLPGAPAEITPAWLERLLAPPFAGLRVTAVGGEVIGAGYGLDGTVVRLGLVTSPRPPPFPLVAKLTRAKPGAAEIGFYRTIAPRMPVRLPRFVAGAVDDAADRAVLLMEDICPAVQGDVLEGATAGQARTVIRAMARFHKAFAGNADGLPAWGTAPDRLAALVRERTPRFLGRYGASLPPGGSDLVAALPEAAPECEARLREARPTLIHGDLHLDNVLFPAPDEPVILDWTHVRRGPAAVDLAHFLIEGLTATTRPRLQDDLLDGYARLAGCEREGLARDVRDASVRRAASAVTWGGAEDPGFDRPRVREIVDSLVRNALAAALGLDP